MQLVLVILAIVAASAYLGWLIYKKFFSGKKDECEGCAIGKSVNKDN